MLKRHIFALKDKMIGEIVVFLLSKKRIIMKKNTLLLAFLFLFIMLGGRAQTLVPNGPETEIEEGARFTVLGEDEHYLYLGCLKMGWLGSYDDMVITVYDKQKNVIAVEHEIDEDYEFRIAYMRGNDVVLLGEKYNKKTKSEDYYAAAFPIMGKLPKKLVCNTIYSMSAEGQFVHEARILLSPDLSKIAFLTYTKPSNKDAQGYRLDVQVVDAEGNTVTHAQEQFRGEAPYDAIGFLSEDGTVFVKETRYYRDNNQGRDLRREFGFLTVTTNGEVVPFEPSDNIRKISDHRMSLLPGKNAQLFFFGETEKGIATFIINGEGELSEENIIEMDKTDVPDNITYEDEVKDMAFHTEQIISLQDGRILVLAYRHKEVVYSDGKYVHTNNYYQNIYLYLFDKKGDLLNSAVLPYSCVDGGNNHQDIPVAFEWKGDLWLLYNGEKNNYGAQKPHKWHRLVYTKPEPRCVVMGRLDNDLDFEPKILYAPTNPKKTFSFGDYYDKVIRVTDDAVYLLMHRGTDNYIDKITE